MHSATLTLIAVLSFMLAPLGAADPLPWVKESRDFFSTLSQEKAVPESAASYPLPAEKSALQGSGDQAVALGDMWMGICDFIAQGRMLPYVEANRADAKLPQFYSDYGLNKKLIRKARQYALAWYKLGASQGSVLCCHGLARYYLMGPLFDEAWDEKPVQENFRRCMELWEARQSSSLTARELECLLDSIASIEKKESEMKDLYNKAIGAYKLYVQRCKEEGREPIPAGRWGLSV